MTPTYERLYSEAIQLPLYAELKRKYNLSGDDRLRKHFEWREKKNANIPPSALYALSWWESDALKKDADKPIQVSKLNDEQRIKYTTYCSQLRALLFKTTGNGLITEQLDQLIIRQVLSGKDEALPELNTCLTQMTAGKKYV